MLVIDCYNSQCVRCRSLAKRCDEGRPCSRCVNTGHQDTCEDAPTKPRKCTRKQRSSGQALGHPQMTATGVTVRTSSMVTPDGTSECVTVRCPHTIFISYSSRAPVLSRRCDLACWPSSVWGCKHSGSESLYRAPYRRRMVPAGYILCRYYIYLSDRYHGACARSSCPLR